MTSRPPKLPPELGDVRIPKLLPPSTLSGSERCLLPMMIGAPDSTGTLPPPPKALLGTVLHHVRALWRTRSAATAGHGAGAADAIDVLLAHCLEDAHRQLAADPRTSGLVELQQAVGENVYLERRMALRRWAKAGVERQDVTGPGKLDLRLYHQPSDVDLSDQLGEGIEPWLVANDLRLVGRPDLLVREPGNVVHIADDKTGCVVDHKGQVLPSHVAQLELYALMVEHLVPGARVRLSVVGRSSHSISWDSTKRSKVAMRLKEFHEELPAGREFPTATLAVPGRDCQSCRLRPRCGTYSRATMSWWRDAGEGPRPVPFDTWGMLTDVTLTGGAMDLALKDPVGRTVRIAGLSRALGITPGHVGRAVSVFNLEPSQDVRLHNRWLAPTSWHQHSPGRTFPSAVGTHVFLGQRDP